jgi:hypothetical protein
VREFTIAMNRKPYRRYLDIDGTEWEIYIRHYHKGNATAKELRRSQYTTIAIGVKWVAGSLRSVHFATARCRKGDTPTRKKGREVAIERLEEEINEHVTKYMDVTDAQ